MKPCSRPSRPPIDAEHQAGRQKAKFGEAVKTKLPKLVPGLSNVKLRPSPDGDILGLGQVSATP